MSWTQMYSQVKYLFENVNVKLINIRLFDILARCHCILNPARLYSISLKKLSLYLSVHFLIWQQLVMFS